MKNKREFKLKDFFLRNIGWKIGSLLLAIFAWIVIINVDDPSTRVMINNIPVELLNENELVQKGYVYQVESGSSVSITIKGPTSVVDGLGASDFRATADLAEKTPNSDTAQIEVKCVKEEIARQIDIVSYDKENVKLAIDNKVSRDIEVRVEIEGEPEQGYVCSNKSSSPNEIKVSGAQNIIDKIAYAKVSYDISGMSTSITEKVEPVFYDNKDNRISSSLLELSRKTAQVNIEILGTKSIPIHYGISGTPGDGYEVTEVKTNTKTVLVAGTKFNLDNISDVIIPSDVLSIEGAVQNVHKDVPIGIYLPSGIVLIDDNKNFIVDVEIKPLVEKAFRFNIEDGVAVRGLKDGYKAQLDTTTKILEITLKGIEDNLEKVSASDIEGYVKLDELEEGRHSVELFFDEKEGYEIVGKYYVDVEITKQEEETTSQNPTQETTSEKSEPETNNN